jgi:hypothetical protein
MQDCVETFRMATGIQIVFDCSDPAALARFWAEALHYKVQDPPAGFGSWDEFLAAQGVPVEDRNFASAIVDPEGIGPRIYFQRMNTPKPKKNRLHIDINAGAGAPPEEQRKLVDAEVLRLVKLGAAKQKAWEEDGEYWVVMLDPERNEFCVQ